MKSVKSHLSSAFTVIEYLMHDHGDLEIKPPKDHWLSAPQLGCHLYDLCVQMEKIRDQVDEITDWTREALELSKLKPREDTHWYRLNSAKHLMKLRFEMKDMSPDEAREYLESLTNQLPSAG